MRLWSAIAIALIGAGGAVHRYPLVEVDPVQSDAPPGFVAYTVRIWGVIYHGTAADIRLERLPFDDRARPVLLNFEGDTRAEAAAVSRVFLPSAVRLSADVLATDAGPPPTTSGATAQHPPTDTHVFVRDSSVGKSGVTMYRGRIRGLVLRGTLLRQDTGGETQPCGAAGTFIFGSDERYWVGTDFLARPDPAGEESWLAVPDGVPFPAALLKP